jgi:hypothetical protein
LGYSLTYDHPDFPKGILFAIFPLGQLANGEATEITEDQERDFLSTHGMTIRDFFEDRDDVKVTGSPEIKGAEAKELADNSPANAPDVTPVTTPDTTDEDEGGES